MNEVLLYYSFAFRDLNGEHIPLLTSLRDKSYAAIRSKYGLSENQVRQLLVNICEKY